MTERVVTELVIDARASIQGAAEYERAMERAAAAQARQTAVMTGSVAVISREERAWQRLQAAIDPVAKARFAQEAAMRRSMGAANDAVLRGLATEQQAHQVISRLRDQQVIELNEVKAATDRLAISQKSQAAVAQSSGLKGTNQVNTANIAAQFQDIGVTSAMGMNPLQIALQQGTQLSMVLGGQGLTGVVRSLGAAFAAVLSPVSLITIGVVALAAAGIQWLMGMINNTDDATDSLKEHKEWLDQILYGYDKAGEAAKKAVEQAQQLPQGVVASDLGASLREQADALLDLERRLAEARESLNSFLSDIRSSAGPMMTGINRGPELDALQQQVALMLDLGISTASTTVELDAAMTAARELYNTADDPAIRALADDTYTLASELRAARGEIAGTAAALANLQAAAFRGLGVSDAVEQIKRMTPELRTQREIVNDIFATNIGEARTIPEINALVEASDRFNSALEEQEKRQEALKTSNLSGKAAADAVRDYQRITASANDRLAQMEIEQQTLGMTAEAANRLRYAHDLLTQAQQAGIAVSPAQRAELTALANDMAEAQARTDALTKAQQQNAAETKQIVDALGNALGSLFTKPIEDANAFFSTLLSGFASIGQSNLKGLLSSDGLGSLFSETPANDNGGSFQSSFIKAIESGSAKGTEKGAFGGFANVLKNIPGGASSISAGLGGLGMGYQTQNPLMGALGGALSGFSVGGPIGAVIGGIGGIIGGLLGMSEAAEKARKALDEQRASIEDLFKVSRGDPIGRYSQALTQFNKQVDEARKLAEAAGDSGLVARLQAAGAAMRETLGREFGKDLQASINALNGQDYLNAVADAQTRYNQRLADATVLGVDASGAATELSLALRKIVTEGDLTTAQVQELAGAFPLLATEIQNAMGALIVQRAQADVDRDREQLRAAYERESAALQGVIDRSRQFVESLSAFKVSLTLDSSLSPLSPLDKLTAAERQFQDVSAAALGGDETAIGQLESVSRDYLAQARDFYASSDQYAAIFYQVQDTIDQVLADTAGRGGAAEQQLEQLTQQTEQLIDLNASVLSVADAIFALNMSITALAGAQGYYGLAIGGMVPGFAAGGVIGNGAWNRDSVLARYAGGGAIALAGGEYVSRAPSVNMATLPVLDYINRTGAVPSNDNSSAALLSEVKSLRAEVASLKAVTAEGALRAEAASIGTTDAVGRLRREVSQQAVRR